MKNIQSFFFNLTSQYFKKTTYLLHSIHFLIFIMLSIPFTIYLCTILLTSKTLRTTSSNNPFSQDNLIPSSLSSPSPTIIIDPGHGGRDPGKVGTSGTLEKELNLQISMLLKNLLEAQNVKVLMTREEDKDLSQTSANFKASDMKERVAFIQESHADLVISIHQNSYTEPEVYGAQCFYHTDSIEGKKLAAAIQNQIIVSTSQTKIRPIKENSDYYLLKHSPVPTIIVECGFLSCPDEEKLLLSEEYQHKMAWAIHLGILQYFNQT